MSIGTTIKKLRRERDMTQEQLAEYLGISANAVSQWECDRTAPDISQLPMLANIFEVTTDHLLDVDISQKQEKIEKIRESAWTLCNAGNKDGAIMSIREGLMRYPNNYEMMYDITAFLYQRAFHQECTPDEYHTFCAEAADYIDKIVCGCGDMKIKAETIKLACSILPAVGRYNDALNLIDTVPDTSKDEILTALYSGSKLIDHVKGIICKSVSTAADQILWLATAKNDNGNLLFDEDEQILLYQKAIGIYKTLYEDGDFYFDAETIAEAEKQLANIWASRGNVEKTLYHLAECVKYVIMFDTYDEMKVTHTSIIPFGMSPVGINWNNEWNKSHDMLMRIKDDSDYDFLRDNAGYKNLIEELSRTDNVK